MMKDYNKLVRDKRPTALSDSGKDFAVRMVKDSAEFQAYLTDAITDHWQAYRETPSPAALADVTELLAALAKQQNLTLDELLAMNETKAAKEGGFEKGVILLRLED